MEEQANILESYKKTTAVMIFYDQVIYRGC